MAKKQNYIWQNDRNFALDKYEQQQYYYVVESNDLISKAKHDLTTNQLKIIDFLISKIKPDDKDFEELETSMYELTNVLEIKRSGRTYNQIANTLDDLRKKEVTIYNQERESIVRTGWVSSAEYFKNGKVILSFDKKLAPYLLDLSKNYSQYLLIDTVKLKSKYAILLYKLMREADRDNGKSITILQGTPEEFKDWLGAPKNYNYGRLKENVLKKAIEEINLKIDDMNLEILQGRYGRKVVQVEIHNNWTVQRATEENAEAEYVESITTHDWLNGGK
ncbi:MULTISPECIES: replication initiation protein [Enterococcus]|jgi:plasmid replication initiation protein|uniref:replication initiation protein n=1 Tax=Enterococcus TaxID=1350 RepID=UPI00027C7E95|nr:replication initiation protein [Enterococcus faecalis]EGO8535541.1 RepB family plasmid replication initiator protein [Enterococcus faecalis]EHB5052897.1 replication initiation protein [Enterococcus faecalis]EJU94640.1 initiator RepB protein [Enterococcus faecalis 599]EKK0915744.1 replication initiation protein [Enterococcus faecalis]EKN1420710.1 replication initiation protein [Enterococcus faecalis]